MFCRSFGEMRSIGPVEGGARCILCDADRLFQITRHVLAPNPEAFLTEPSIPEERWKGFCTQYF